VGRRKSSFEECLKAISRVYFYMKWSSVVDRSGIYLVIKILEHLETELLI
jgi:hypothetical protein